MADIRVSCLLPGAGTGERLGLGPKAFLELGGRPILRWVADKALRVADEVLVAVPPGLIAEATAMLPECRVIEGGATRQDSIALLARQARGEWLIVHDAARPFVSQALLQAVLDTACGTDCAGAFVSPLVPVARLRDGYVAEAHAGSDVGIAQTPQVYSRANMDLMLQHLERNPGWFAQSVMELALAASIRVRAVPGEVGNIKITTMDDWQRACQQADLLA